MAEVSVIWAEAANGVIGRANAIPWRIPEDLAHFRRLTTGATVLMGRRTWDSLPGRFRPLPDRRNLVLTRNPALRFAGAEPVASIEDALERVSHPPGGDLWVIGGAAVYAAALPYATRAVLTQLRDPVEGDTVAPRLDDRFREVADTGWLTSDAGPVFRIREYSGR